MNNEVIWGCARREELDLKIVAFERNAYIADVKVLFRGEISSGQIKMIEADKYDIAAYYLVKSIFGIMDPLIGVLTVDKTNYIVAGRRMSRNIVEKDYYPWTQSNDQFKFDLAVLIYVSRLAGVSISLREIEIVDGSPIFWQCHTIGNRRCRTVTAGEFMKIFGLRFSDAMKGKLNNFARKVIDHVRSFDFDTDVLRGFLFFNHDYVKWAKGRRTKFKLSRNTREIAGAIEEGYMLLLGEYPFKIFR